MSKDKIELLKQMQKSELSAIKGQHERAMQRLKDQQRNELESLAKKHSNSLNITEDRIVNLERVASKTSEE